MIPEEPVREPEFLLWYDMLFVVYAKILEFWTGYLGINYGTSVVKIYYKSERF